MKRFDHHAVGIQQGAETLFSACEDGGLMWTGDGPREHRQKIHFDEPFRDAPVIHVGLSMWDIDKSNNQRADVESADIGPDGFTIVFKTWGDTRVARVRAEWLAIGPVRHKDSWDL